MVTAKESQTYQQFSAWNSSYLDGMSLLQQNYTFGQSSSDFRGFNTARQDAQSPFLINAQSALPNGAGVANKPSVDVSSVPQKRFLIFDQSGNHTRLFFSPSFSTRNEIIVSKDHSFPNGGPYQDDKFMIDPVEEKWDENHLSDEEGEMIEDSEEIDALLYSESDDDNDDDEEEVTSMMHSPFSIEEKEDKSHEKINEEVTSSKRQRLADGKYKKSSLTNTEESSFLKRAISSNYEEDDINSVDTGNKNDNKRESKIKIHRALNILESIIPGSNGQDPLSILDKAIAYLKSMKAEAEDLGCT